MAISLAVMVFLVGGVRRHEDMDDPLYEWFLTRAFVRPVFLLTVLLTLGTMAAFFLSRTLYTCALPNLVLFAGGSMGLSVGVIIGFALWTLRILRPSQYRRFKREVTAKAVRDAAVAHAKFLCDVRSGQAPDGAEAKRAAQEADIAVQRVVDDIERAIRSARFTDFEEGLDTLQGALYIAISKGTLRQAVGDAPDPPHPGLSWPMGPPLVEGLARLDRLCLRERLSDYSKKLHWFRQRWMRESIARGHGRALGDATTSLYLEYGVSREESHHSDRQRVVEDAAVLLFPNLNHLRMEGHFQLSPGERYDLGRLLVQAVQRYGGDLLEHGDYEEATGWLDQLARYIAMHWPLGGERRQEFTSPVEEGPSLQTYSRIAGMSVAGRALELDAKLVIDHLKERWFEAGSSAFPADELAGDLTWAPKAISSITDTWQGRKLLQSNADMDDWKAVFSSSRYALVFYLWIGAHADLGGATRRHVPNNERTVQDLRDIWSNYGDGMLYNLYGDTEEKGAARQLVNQWLGTQDGAA